MPYKRILTMQDISCVGQCSMTVALPILSACGQEVCILPTAVLSSHTGGFRNPHIRNLSADILPACDHWKREGIDFDYIYTGYLGSIQEIEYARMIGRTMRAPGDSWSWIRPWPTMESSTKAFPRSMPLG